jgi:hypothetical protein
MQAVLGFAIERICRWFVNTPLPTLDNLRIAVAFRTTNCMES